ncbi:MAG: restriction endonuclease subunit S [Anaerolineales bacterium]|nr:restriction endonuclease subunit S [Anaerolineales bacterium]
MARHPVSDVSPANGLVASYNQVVSSPDEQHGIIRYLDYMDRRIRRYIRAKQKLIALLEEQKQAIIHQAVTRGLDPNVRLKPSGVEWLGDVPEHWSEVTVGQIAESLQTGPFGSQLHASDYVEGGIPVINPLHLRGGKICADSKFAVSQDTVARLSRHKLELDDVVIGRRGEMGRCGLVGAEEVGWLCGTGSMRLRPKPGFFDPKYLLLLLTSKRVGEFLSLVSVGATMENLNPSIVSRVRLPCPPVAEQQRIIALVNDLTSHVEHAIKRAEREIALLREYRTRLIADVVTGQVDVRAAAAQLPDETELDQIVNEEEAQNNGEEELELAEEGEEIYE